MLIQSMHQMTESAKGQEGLKELVKDMADILVDEMARKMYYKLLMVRFLPEIKAIESGKLKALKGKEIEKFLKELS